MSKSPDEPGNAAFNAPVEPGLLNRQENDGGNLSRRPVLQRPSRHPSSSLLTRLFAPTLEEEVEPLGSLIGGAKGDTCKAQPTAHDITNRQDKPLPSEEIYSSSDVLQAASRQHSEEQQEMQSTTSYWPRGKQGNGYSSRGTISVHENSMASTMTMSVNALSLGPSPRSTSPRIDISDMTYVNNMLNGHRDFLKQCRGRGTSLERTQKERRVQTMPLENASNNPGDTGMTRPSTPLSATDLTSKADSPMDGVRARYRSWRDARPAMVATEKAWSIGDDAGTGILTEGQVEKSIADALAGIEPNSRSRKASHSLRFFKEGLPEEPKKKDKDRGRSKDQAQRARDPVTTGVGSSDGTPGTPGRENSGSYGDQYLGGNSFSGTVSGTLVTTTSPKKMASISPNDKKVGFPVDVSMPSINKLPQQLLDDLRKRHNLLPASKKVYFLSQSRQPAESARLGPVSDRNDQQPKSGQLAAKDIEELASDLSSVHEEDEDSSEEKISSALFVPHQASRESKLREHDRSDSDTCDLTSGGRKTSSDLKAPEDWLVKHELPASKFTEGVGSQSPAEHYPPAPGEHIPDSDTEYLPEPQTPSDFGDGMSDGGYMSRDSGTTTDVEVTDVEDTTPTGTLKVDSHMMQQKQEHLHSHQNESGPPAAIELIPYKHQVGGHTTMWRFSKRAVCKQLNNRENEFYEKVEKNHPKLLKFMPR